MTENFIPTDELRKIAKGSFQYVSAQLDAEIQKAPAKIFGENVRAKVFATFPGYATVISENKKVVRVKYEESQNGQLKIVSVEPMNLPIYTEENIDAFLFKEAKKVVTDFFGGRVDEAQNRLKSLAFFVEDRADNDLPEKEVVAALLKSISADRPWKKMYQERADKIREFIRTALVDLEKAKLQPKFAKLYDGTVSESDSDGYRELVVGDLGYLTDRVTALTDLIQAASSAVRQVEDKVSAEDGPMLTTFAAFSEDLGSDLDNLSQILRESTNHMRAVGSLGQLYDAVAEGLYTYEVAGRFVNQMANKLVDSAK